MKQIIRHIERLLMEKLNNEQRQWVSIVAIVIWSIGAVLTVFFSNLSESSARGKTTVDSVYLEQFNQTEKQKSYSSDKVYNLVPELPRQENSSLLDILYPRANDLQDSKINGQLENPLDQID